MISSTQRNEVMNANDTHNDNAYDDVTHDVTHNDNAYDDVTHDDATHNDVAYDATHDVSHFDIISNVLRIDVLRITNLHTTIITTIIFMMRICGCCA